MAADVANAIVRTAIESNAAERLTLDGSVGVYSPTIGRQLLRIPNGFGDLGFNLRLRVFGGGVSGARSTPPAELFLEPFSQRPSAPLPITVELTEETIPSISTFIVESFGCTPSGYIICRLGKRDSSGDIKILIERKKSFASGMWTSAPGFITETFRQALAISRITKTVHMR